MSIIQRVLIGTSGLLVAGQAAFYLIGFMLAVWNERPWPRDAGEAVAMSFFATLYLAVVVSAGLISANQVRAAAKQTSAPMPGRFVVPGVSLELLASVPSLAVIYVTLFPGPKLSSGFEYILLVPAAVFLIPGLIAIAIGARYTRKPISLL